MWRLGQGLQCVVHIRKMRVKSCEVKLIEIAHHLCPSALHVPLVVHGTHVAQIFGEQGQVVVHTIPARNELALRWLPKALAVVMLIEEVLPKNDCLLVALASCVEHEMWVVGSALDGNAVPPPPFICQPPS